MPWEGFNRRKFPRVNFPCLVKVALGGMMTEALLAHTENLSVGGVCVILKTGLERFSEAGLEIDLMDGEDHIACRGRVMWVVRRKATESLKPSFYDMGFEFIDIKDADRARIGVVVDHLARVQQKAKL